MPGQPIPVRIFHQSYTLIADDDPREVQEIANRVDELMTSIAERTSSADSARIAVLACFHLVDKLRAAERRLDLFEAKSERIGSLLEEAIGNA